MIGPGLRGSPNGTREARAAEDRHIGFRWLAWEARAGSEADAEPIFRAVVAELTPRLGADESRHVASHLPLGLREVWEQEDGSTRRPGRVDRAEVVAGVQSRLGLERLEDADFLFGLVVAWLKHLAPEERDDVAAMLPPGLRELWGRAQLPMVPAWARLVRSPAGYRPEPRVDRPAERRCIRS
jgi:uncharacterized protein (DUF2267 family)